MCDLRADLSAICACHDRSTDDLAAELWQLDELRRGGLVRRSADSIEVPERGRAFVRSVCAVFDAYLADSETRFSRAS